MNRDHPVIVALRDNTKIRPSDLDFIIEHGQSYQGTALPSSVKRLPLGECLIGAEEMVERGLGKFVGGLVLRPGDGRPMRHYWCSPDGARAYDPTLQDPRSNEYVGLAARHRDRLDSIVARTFRGSMQAGVPVDLARGGLKIPGLRPFVFRM